MASEKKRIEAALRNKLANQYADKIEFYRNRASEYVRKYKEADRNLDLYKQKLEEAEEKIRQYEDWIERLQDFVNMPEGTREEQFNLYLSELKHKEIFNTNINLFNQLFSWA